MLRAVVESFFIHTWSRRGLFAILLWPISKLFEFLIHFRYGLQVLGFRAQTTLPVPVIIVGNIYLGGTGKTPMVIWLIENLRQAGWNPGVISRGYGARVENIQEVNNDSLATEVGDEPLLIFQRTSCPMMVGRRRVASAQQLLNKYPTIDVIISDDGLQHYRLGRDIEILMFDQRGVGNGLLLPAGPLREPVRRRRDFTILNSVECESLPEIGKVDSTMRLQVELLTNLARPEKRLPLTSILGKKILAAAGIGNPQRFFDMLSLCGLDFESMPLADHFDFSPKVFADVDAEIILITEKDAVKCRQIEVLRNDPRIWIVPVSAHLDSKFRDSLLNLLAITSENKNGCTSA
ncbi:tetraacyldisaccharide 4'-kinase [Undibacterium fentianense]|uniref:Tetraacyldisaccharide 4'-kinase n=1 Tax=Undibacterium fentianense TaxID=2828728 RepID=A0A941E3L7_9BURK|nr:tetraacyldisaccharide 4'-kinase [Undibacterium fentianense]MBR7799979.1 tetraacyldisaccharide 4'-kinase [Undibacterium fentianense]